MDANRFSRNKNINAGDRNKSLARLWRSRFLFSEKMTSLDVVDMHFVIFDIFVTYVINIWSKLLRSPWGISETRVTLAMKRYCMGTRLIVGDLE